MNYLSKPWTAQQLEALSVGSSVTIAGTEYLSLRAHVRQAIVNGDIRQALTGVEVAGLNKAACIALLLGQQTATASSAQTMACPICMGKRTHRNNCPTCGEMGIADVVPVAAATVTAARTPDAPDNGMAALAAMLSPHLAATLAGNVTDAITAKLANLSGDLARDIDAKLASFNVQELLAMRPVTYTIHNATTGSSRDIGRQHMTFGDLLAFVDAGINVWLVGPAGSGKTTAAENVAKALDLPFEFNGAIDSEHKLLGFIDAQGRIVSRPFRKCWEQGGVYLFDEVDASMPGALLAFNAALANGFCDFPDGRVEKHPNFRCIAGGNVWNGSTADYCGRMKQDGAFLDRFVQLEWAYDESLERDIAASAAAGMAASVAEGKGEDAETREKRIKAAVRASDDWTSYVQGLRANALRNGIRAIISPRASINGAKLLAQGKLGRPTIERATLRKGLDDATWQKLLTGATAAVKKAA